MITIEDIKDAGIVPESFHNIEPGRAIFYASKADGISSSTKNLVIYLIDKCQRRHEGFALNVRIETTSNRFLENTIVARRLNLGSLYRYNLLIACVNCKESVDAFVSEFFNLASRGDEELKFINKERTPRYDYDYNNSSFAPSGMLEMIVMSPPTVKVKDVEEEDNVPERDPKQVEDENRILQEILDYADKYKMEIPRNILFPLTDGRYVLTDDTNVCRLKFTEDRKFVLKAGTTVELKLTKLQKAFYLLLLAHPKGIEARRLSEHKDELISYYYLVFKGGGDDDKVYNDVESLISIKDQGYKYDMPALEQLRSKLNKQLALCILNRTSQEPFKVKNTNGVLHIDLDRKFFEWGMDRSRFEIKY